jgi:hypothetical protein
MPDIELEMLFHDFEAALAAYDETRPSTFDRLVKAERKLFSAPVTTARGLAFKLEAYDQVFAWNDAGDDLDAVIKRAVWRDVHKLAAMPAASSGSRPRA